MGARGTPMTEQDRTMAYRARPAPAAATAIPPDHPRWVRCPAPPDMTISPMGNLCLRQAFTTAPDELGTARTHATAPIGR